MAKANTKVWFITCTSSGFGRNLAEEVLKKGDRAWWSPRVNPKR